MTLDDLLNAAGTMDDKTFAEYWPALGTAIRLASRTQTTPPHPAPPRTEINTTAAVTERQWSPVQQTPAAPFGFTGSA